jgi:hypothetical protein
VRGPNPPINVAPFGAIYPLGLRESALISFRQLKAGLPLLIDEHAREYHAESDHADG